MPKAIAAPRASLASAKAADTSSMHQATAAKNAAPATQQVTGECEGLKDEIKELALRNRQLAIELSNLTKNFDIAKSTLKTIRDTELSIIEARAFAKRALAQVSPEKEVSANVETTFTQPGTRWLAPKPPRKKKPTGNTLI